MKNSRHQAPVSGEASGCTPRSFVANPVAWLLVAGTLLSAGCKKSDDASSAQTPPAETSNHEANFTSVEYYPAPNESQLKTRLSGADVQPLEGGALDIKQLKLEWFTTNGLPQVIVKAPECVYDPNKGEAHSPGKLFVQNGDGKIRIEGDGFLWRQSDSSLTISNNVRTTAETDLKGKPVP